MSSIFFFPNNHAVGQIGLQWFRVAGTPKRTAIFIPSVQFWLLLRVSVCAHYNLQDVTSMASSCCLVRKQESAWLYVENFTSCWRNENTMALFAHFFPILTPP
jgi:hypothetical protein